MYLPFELTAIISAVIYAILLIGWKGQTIGKAFCGLTVKTTRRKSIGYLQAFLREIIGKLISGAFFLVGYFWIAISRSKRGWHDYIACTTVVKNLHAERRARAALILVLVFSVFLVIRKGYEITYLYSNAKQMTLSPGIKSRYADRDPSSLIEVSSLREEDKSKFVEWLDHNAKNPVEYAIETASKHQVTIFGEEHEKKDLLVFLNKIIPELYHKTGVTCIAMEVCTEEDNETINKLVTAAEYDHGLALQIARNMPWEGWGFKEYWDVFETVWKLNRSLRVGQKKLRVVGIDTKWNAPSIALMGLGDDGLKSPIWEKLRIFRLIDDFFRLPKRDELMARNVEKEIIEKGERGIIWVGFSHSFIHYRQPRGFKGEGRGRMGFILYQKYGNKVFQINLQTRDSSPSMIYADHHGPEPKINGMIEDVMRKTEYESVGFDVSHSPFALLRDSTSDYYHFQPRVSFADVSAGYIYFKPWNELQQCDWLPGYISPKMFAENKIFYELKLKKKFKNAEELNSFFMHELTNAKYN